MRNYFWIVCICIISTMGCAKKQEGCTPVDPKTEEPAILAYASANGITAMKHSSGMYYQIVDPGTGKIPTASSSVTVTYTGKLLNGTTFDQSTTPIYLSLSQVIEGWQIGIPLIGKGGHIKLIIPSSLAYGCNGVGAIPANAVLFFDINLVDVL